jgi:phosphatidylinositol alpha-1,6-mannosyltransferase
MADRLHCVPAALCAKVGAGARVPCFVWVYGTEIISHRRRLLKRLLIQMCNRSLAISDWTGFETGRLAPRAGRPVVVRPGVVNADWERPRDLDRPALRSRLGLPEEAFIVLSVARVAVNARHKGLDRVAEAVRLLRDEGRPVTHLIVGSGDDEAWLEDRLAATETLPFTHWHKRLSKEQLRDMYWAADLFVLPSQTLKGRRGEVQAEGFGLVFLEAAAAGCPSVGTNSGGASEAIASGQSGMFCDGSSTSIANAIRDVITGIVKFDRSLVTAWALENDWVNRRVELVRAVTVERDHPSR